ncbi:50S ribosomal protein L23 [Candidatus Falkowbacteria bacterium CG11_big_fil_rev_8_21_14_0_20_39_10]|uniref:Large ribosomal subunit protein uL23 n=1 Tax=Candidatus Falkowbacteria bacterium CG11_big_fil_rev_8_21_14_0_20_39_10 TaxID=1974570 RepID=A0A2M6K993_9BACT|nr:MAG: 50S ribosomal protein L23 [Candidatus Falkowbacteria bacterium CG11_big_fil_rev_8_21_14_0_20_39_10]
MKDLYGESQAKAPKREKNKVDAKDKPEEKKIESKVRKHGNAYKILVKPLVTEKAADLSKENKYVFEVNLGVNKIEIAKAVEEIYGIKPLSVNIIKASGKSVRYGRTQGRKKNWKKAIIKLPAGKDIKIYEGV